MILLSDAAHAALLRHLRELDTNTSQAELEAPEVGHLMRLNREELAGISALIEPQVLAEVIR